MDCVIVQNKGIGRSGVRKGGGVWGMRYVNDNYYLAVAGVCVYMQMHYATAGPLVHSCVYGRTDVFTVSPCLSGCDGNLSSHHNHQSCHILFKNTYINSATLILVLKLFRYKIVHNSVPHHHNPFQKA
jgi:hypothetical protein